jgi:endo-1,4-beta-mannosidase
MYTLLLYLTQALVPACRDDPTIMAWSLANEPRCQGDYSGATLQARQRSAAHCLS